MTTSTGVRPAGSGTVTAVKLTSRSACSVHSTGTSWVPGTNCRQPFSRSQRSTAIQAAMQVPGCARR